MDFHSLGAKTTSQLQIRAFPTKVAQMHHSPRDDRVHGQAVFDAMQCLELTIFHPTARFQRAKVNFNLPAEAVHRHHVLNVFDGRDGQCRHQQPADRLTTVGSVRFFDQNQVHGDRGEFAIRTQGRLQRDSRGTHTDMCRSSVAGLASLSIGPAPRT